LGALPIARISIQNFLRASEIFLHEHNNYSNSELTLLRAMLGRLDAKLNKGKDTKGPGGAPRNDPLRSKPTFNRGTSPWACCGMVSNGCDTMKSCPCWCSNRTRIAGL